MPFLLLAAASVAQAAAPPISPEAAARELSELTKRLGEDREELVHETVALGGIGNALGRKNSGGRHAAETQALITAILNDERRKGRSSLELRTALLAEQLHRYKQTGVFSPPPPAIVASLKKLIEEPWTDWAGLKPVPGLSLDLAQLQKDLRRWRGTAESFPAPVPKPAPPAVAGLAVGSGFVRDRGTGKAEGDPVPELILQLSAPEPRRRALAADALAGRGVAVRPAVPALTRALSDPDGRVRASAALALGAAGGLPPDAAAGLRRALDDKDPEVRMSARLALERLEQ